MKKQPALINSVLWLGLAFSGLSSCTKPTEQAAAPVIVEEKQEELKYDTNDPASMIKAVEMTVGSWDKLWEQKDVEFTYD